MISKNILLGSQSPRRKELLLRSGYTLSRQIGADIEEILEEHQTPQENAERLAREKAIALLSQLNPDEVLITADTIVSKNDLIYGKPVDLDEAKVFIKSYSNTIHSIHTGVCIADRITQKSFHVTSKVEFGPISDAEIRYYLANCEVMDKAGAYGIQDWLGLVKIKKIIGSYTNIMGLPMEAVYQMLKNWHLE